MEESDVTESGESNNTSSSISNAVNELLCMTNAAVKKLTDPRQALSDSSLSVDPEASDRNTSDDRHGDKRLLEILSETKNTTIEDNAEAETHELQDETSSQNVESRGKVIDVTSALADAAKSPVSILDVGGGEMDSSASTPPTNRPLETDLSPGAGLSPIMLETHGRREDEEIEGSFIESIRHKEGKDNLTSSVKSGVKSDSPNASRNSSTASEVLKLSSRVPALPESARLPNSHMKTQPTPDKESGELKQPETVVIELEEKPANVIIRKSQHARDAAADRIAPPERERVAPHRVRVPKKRMQEVERPIATNEQGNSEQHHPRTGTKPQSAASPMKSTLSQGVATTLDDKENKGADPRLDKDLKIIKSDVGSTKKRLLEARKTGMQYKRTVPANIVNEKTMHKRIAQSHPSEVMAYAMQHTAPMIKVQQDLEAQVVRLTDKLNELERQKQREESLKHQERSVDLERKLDEVTAQRLRSLEQLQEQQAAWQGQFLKVVGNMQNTQNQLNDAVTEKGTVPGRTVRFDDFKRSHDVLQTPAPRPQAPHPTLSKERRKGTSPGNGYLLKNILEQMDVSTPGPSPAVYPAKLARDPLVEVTPVRGPAQKPLAKDGRNIVMSIHQPRYSIFSLFDSLIILRAGRNIYRGQASRAVDHFASIGYECPQFHNPADFFLDIVGGDLETAQLLGRMRTLSAGQESLEEAQLEKNGTSNGKWADTVATDHSAINMMPASNNTDEEGDKLFYGFVNSQMAKDEENALQVILQQYMNANQVDAIGLGTDMDSYPNGFFSQFGYVSGRTVRNIIRNPMTSVAQVFMMVFFGVLMGLLYFQLDLTPIGLQNRAGCFFFLIMSQVMSNLSALELFIKQRAHFMHESASGYYRVSVYFLALVFADLIPNRLIPNILFSTIIYFMTGFQMDAGKFFFFVLTLVMTAMAASSLAFLVSASVRVFALANILVAVPYLLMMMFGGFLANTTSMLDWLEWIKWLSIFRYGINALSVNELSGLTFISNSSAPGYVPDSQYPCISKDPAYPGPIAECVTGEMYMTTQGIPYGTAWDLWINIVVLSAMAVGFLIMSYVQLRRVKKYK